MSVITSASAAIFAVFIVIVLVWLTDWLLCGMAKTIMRRATWPQSLSSVWLWLPDA